MKILTKDDFTQPAAVNVEPVEIPREGTAYIRVMSGARREAYLDHVRHSNGNGSEEKVSLSARLVAASLCDEKGQLFWPDGTEPTPEELQAIGDRPWYWLDPLVEKAGLLNGFSTAGKEAAKNALASPA